MGNMRTCKYCDQAKPLDQFYGARTQCKACLNARRFDVCACGTRKRTTANQCRGCQSRAAQALATTARADSLRLPPEVWALRRAKALTRRWLREEGRRRCPICLKRVRGKGARYCSYACFSITQVPQGKRQSIKPRLRARVIARDGYVCQICNRPTSLVHDPRDDLSPEIDHIVPVYDGGTNDLGNLRVAHRICNRDRNLVLYIS
jgi:5-methylcytosine-specific restriction endonuclease McrA